MTVSRRSRALVALALVLAVVVFVLSRAEPPTTATPVEVTPRDEGPGAAGPEPTLDEAARTRDSLADALAGRGLDAPPATEAERRALLERITAWAEGRMNTVRGRVGFLEQLVRFLQQLYPDTWRAELERMLRDLFPGEYESLLALWGARESWDAWLTDHRSDLARMSPEERRSAMWEARRDFFGDEADELFEGVRRNESIADALAAIESEGSGSVRERFGRFMDAVEDAYGEDAPAFVDARRQELLDRFVEIPSVQTDLAALPREDRYVELRQMRAESGMDEEALTRWDALDRVRDTRRDTGARYVEARAQAAASLEGDALEARLRELRTEFFGEEGSTIANEEASGFFRFEVPQVYGRD